MPTGYRYLVEEARDAGQPMAERTAWRICSDNQWWSAFGKKKRVKNRKPGPPVHDDLVDRDFTTDAPNRLWLSTITEHRVVPPVSVQRDARVLPRWKVYARLISESLTPPSGPLGGGSQLILAFFCNDIASSPITEVIGWRLASLDEAIWRQLAEDWEP